MADNLLIFGGGILQLSIIEEARNLGFKTIVIDPDQNAPAINKADVFIRVAVDDFVKTKQIALDYNIIGLLTTATDKPILMMCRVAEELGLPFPSYKSCEIMLDKGKFKEFLKVNNIPHAAGTVYNNLLEVDKYQYKYPVIIKPLINSGSRGVFKCEYADELHDFIKEAQLYCEDNKFIIEEYVEGDEISVEAFVFNGEVCILQITDKIISESPYNVELGHFQPSKYSNKKKEINCLLQKVINLLGFNNAVIHPEIKINGGNITIIEIGPRLGGDYITSKLVPLSTGVSIEEIQIRLSTGTPFKFKTIEKAAIIEYLSFPQNRTVTKVLSEDILKTMFPELIEFKHTLTRGQKINQITSSMNRYGHYILYGNSINHLKYVSSRIQSFLNTSFFQ